MKMALDGGVRWECYGRVRGRGPSRGGWSEGDENKPGSGLHKYLSTKLFHNIMNGIR